ncbi:UNVERIFIED_CONTAM: hypothetical protein GTU68_032257 [Idotea baltica]|nr:hypothetical protein [Idotea baltica]
MDIQQFFKVCKMPDTFYSWYLVTELHLWMLCTRLMAEGTEGKVVRDTLLKTLWMDVEERAKKLEGSNVSARKEQVQELTEHFRTSFLSYDESLDGDDRILASALWRIFFQKECYDLKRLETCVNFVRKNIALLDSIPKGEIIVKRKLRFLPLLDVDQLRHDAML